MLNQKQTHWIENKIDKRMLNQKQIIEQEIKLTKEC